MVFPKYLATVLWLGFLLMLCGCDPCDVCAIKSNLCDIDLSKLIPPDWEIDSKQWVDPVCVVFYHYELPKEGSKIAPVRAAAFRLDEDRPRDLHAYPLAFPDGQALGLHELTAEWADVLSDVAGPELVVRDKDHDDIVVEASIFVWRPNDDSEKSQFEPHGLFYGDRGVRIETDKVEVFNRRPEMRSQIVNRQVYMAKGNKTFFEKNTTLVKPAVTDLDCVPMPEEPAASEYPEVAVMGFYKQLPITDTIQFARLVDPGNPLGWWADNKATLGCLADPQTMARVVEIDTRQAQVVPAHATRDTVIKDTVKVQSVCVTNTVGTAMPPGVRWLSWDMEWKRETDRWRLIQVSISR